MQQPERRGFLSQCGFGIGALWIGFSGGRASAQPAPLSNRSPVAQVSGADPPDSSAYAEFRSFLKAIRSARGSFRQSVINAAGRVIETTEGSFAFVRPGRFRWEVKKPFEQLMVADGRELYFYDRDLNQVTIRKLGDALSATPAAILFGNDSIDSDFTFVEAGSRDGLLWLEAVPRQKEAGIERIVIGLRAGLPEALEVGDAFGRLSRFSFGALERNPAIDETLFTFRIPSGADVVRQ